MTLDGRSMVLVMVAAYALAACTNSSSGPMRHGDTGPAAPTPGTPSPGAPNGGVPGQPNPGAPPGPSGPVPTGDISLRIANLSGADADVCVKGDDGKWQGPLFRGVAGGALASGSVSERIKVKNSHFNARLVLGADCNTPQGADVPLQLVSATWSITLVVADAAGGAKLAPLVDTPTGSSDYTFFRVVNTGTWGTDADLGILDCCGDFTGLALDVPALGVPKAGSIDAEGYAFIAPLDGNTSLLFRSSTTENQIFQLDGLQTTAQMIYSLYTMGTVDNPSILVCNDDAPATAHVTCQVAPNGN